MSQKSVSVSDIQRATDLLETQGPNHRPVTWELLQRIFRYGLDHSQGNPWRALWNYWLARAEARREAHRRMWGFSCGCGSRRAAHRSRCQARRPSSSS